MALSVEVTCDQPSRWWHKEQPLCPHCHTAIHVHTLPSIKLLNSLVSDASIIDGFNMPILNCDIMKRNWSWVASHKPYKAYSIPGIIKLHWIQRTLLWLCPDGHKRSAYSWQMEICRHLCLLIYICTKPSKLMPLNLGACMHDISRFS